MDTTGEVDAERRRPGGCLGDVLVAVDAEPACARTRTRQPAKLVRSADALVGWPGGALAAVSAETEREAPVGNQHRG
jgi:hypothetical protein